MLKLQSQALGAAKREAGEWGDCLEADVVCFVRSCLFVLFCFFPGVMPERCRKVHRVAAVYDSFVFSNCFVFSIHRFMI